MQKYLAIAVLCTNTRITIMLWCAICLFCFCFVFLPLSVHLTRSVLNNLVSFPLNSIFLISLPALFPPPSLRVQKSQPRVAPTLSFVSNSSLPTACLRLWRLSGLKRLHPVRHPVAHCVLLPDPSPRYYTDAHSPHLFRFVHTHVVWHWAVLNIAFFFTIIVV